MRELIHIIIIIFTLSMLAGQDTWSGVSVATPENLDAITNNPAGLGISRDLNLEPIFPLVLYLQYTPQPE